MKTPTAPDAQPQPGNDPKRLKHVFEYHAVRFGIGFLSILPMNVASWMGRRLGELLHLAAGRHRRRAYEQARERLGLGEDEGRRFVKKNFRHYGMIMAEFAQLSRMTAADIARNTDFNGVDELMRRLLAEGKGVLLIPPHYGNWEWCNSTATSLGVQGGSIARPLDNARVNELVRSVRERNGLAILDKAGAIRKALGILRRNGVVGVLIDQDAGKQGMMSPFLGKPASTLTVPVELALRTGSPMVTLACRRRESGPGKRFAFACNPVPFRPDLEADPKEETRRLVDALNDSLGRLILENPAQWLWVHRRWKSVGRW